jgi:hypothetical protein
MEDISASLEIMYGTLMSPILMGFGFDPLIAAPCHFDISCHGMYKRYSISK